MPYRTNWLNDRFTAEFFGEVSATEIHAVNALFCGDARFDTVRSSIWDMTGISNLDIGLSAVEDAAAFDKGASLSKPRLKGAIVVLAGHVRDQVEQYLSIAGELDVGWDTRVFDNIEAAKNWLDS